MLVTGSLVQVLTELFSTSSETKLGKVARKKAKWQKLA